MSDIKQAIADLERQSICRPRVRLTRTSEEREERRLRINHSRQHLKAFLRGDTKEASAISAILKEQFDYDVDKQMYKSHAMSAMFKSNFAVVVFKDKYGESVFDVSTPDNFAKAFLTVLKNRVADGYWYSNRLDVPEGVDPNQYSLFDSHQRTDYERAQSILEIAKDHKELKWAGLQAFQFLNDRRDYEYEGFDFFSFDEYDTEFANI